MPKKGMMMSDRGVEEEDPRKWVSRMPQSWEGHHQGTVIREETRWPGLAAVHMRARSVEKDGLLVLCSPCQHGSGHILFDPM